MAKKSKKETDSSTATIDLGKARKQRIAEFRAKKQLENMRIDNVEDAVNMLIDKALEEDGEGLNPRIQKIQAFVEMTTGERPSRSQICAQLLEEGVKVYEKTIVEQSKELTQQEA